MPKKLDEMEEDVEVAEDPNAALAASIVAAVNANSGPRKIGIAEWQRTRSVHRNKPILDRKYYQNGILLDRNQLTADAITMLNSLQAGSYADGLLRVNAVSDGNKMSALDICYNNKSVDLRMELKSKFPSFEHMLVAMLKEARGPVVAS
jgi:hypothetical protein